jgi:hypothetical protein
VTLTDFLLARIADDAASAQSWPDHGYEPGSYQDPGRVLAECAVKQQIIRWASVGGHRTVLRLLALPYRDHEDYDLSWQPFG